MLQTLNIRLKLIGSFLAIGTFCIVILGFGSFYIAKNALQEAAFTSLTALREMKKQQIEEYFMYVRDNVDVFSQDFMIIDAMKEFKNSFLQVQQDDNITKPELAQLTTKLKRYYRDQFLPKLNANIDEKMTVEQFFEHIGNPTIILQNLYIVDNPYQDQKSSFNRADDKSKYSQVHAKYNPFFREYLERFEYYDLFLIDAQTGYVVYNVSKEIDFAANITKGPLKKSNLTEGFFKIQESTSKDFIKFTDFQSYIPSDGMPCAFVLAPIYDGDTKIGVLALQLSIQKINKIMTNDKMWKQTGLGKTGEAYIIGEDYKMRSDSRFLIEDPNKFFNDLEKLDVDKNIVEKMRLLNTTILIQTVNTESGLEVMRGNSDTKLITDYRGVPNISSYTPLAIKDAQWGIIAEMDHEELLVKVRSLAFKLLIIGLFILLIVFGFSFFGTRFILRPMYLILASCKHIMPDKRLNLRERIQLVGNDVVAQLGEQYNRMLHQTQIGMQALQVAHKKIAGLFEKQHRVLDHLHTFKQALHNDINELSEQINQLRQKVNTSGIFYKKYSSFSEQVKTFVNQIQTCLVQLNRIQADLQVVAKENPSQLQRITDEITVIYKVLHDELALLSKKVNENIDTSSSDEQNITHLEKAIVSTQGAATHLNSDLKKIEIGLQEINQHFTQIDQAIKECEKIFRQFTI